MFYLSLFKPIGSQASQANLGLNQAVLGLNQANSSLNPLFVHAPGST